MVSLFLRNLFFTILQPGLVAGLIPFWILGTKFEGTFFKSWQFHKYCGAIIFVTGLIITLSCIVSFAVKGRGTLSPADPTKLLVITGLYKFSRNPMYVGVMMILIGEAVFFQSVYLLMYLLIIFLSFSLFILFFEEPRLERDFGKEYSKYCQNVRRWV